MLNIEIGKYQIKADTNGAGYVVVEHRKIQSGKNVGSVREQVVGYFPRLEDAMEKLLHLRVRSSDSRSFQDALEEIRAFRREFHALLEGV